HAEGAPQRFGELAADGEHRVQVAHGFLRDVGDLLPAHGAVLAAAAGHQVDAFEVDGPGDHAPPGGEQAEHGEGGLGLAGAGFSDQAMHLAAADAEVHAVDHAGEASVALVVADVQVPDVQQHLSSAVRGAGVV